MGHARDGAGAQQAHEHDDRGHGVRVTRGKAGQRHDQLSEPVDRAETETTA